MINIAQLLKDAPKGLKLYSPIFGEVNFVGVDKQSAYPINVTDCKGNGKLFTEFGVYFAEHPNAECLLFPSKEVRTWEGWKLPVQPKFNVGDDIKTGNTIDTVAEVDYATRSYCCKSGRTIWFENQDLWKLVSKPHYDISNFYAGMPVLVRDKDNRKWGYLLYSHYDNTYEDGLCFNAGSVEWRQCIPYNEETMHLLGTTDMPSEEYINW